MAGRIAAPVRQALLRHPERRAAIVAEVAQSHDGSLGQAHAFVEVAAHCGADAVKFQTHIASEESTAREEWRVRFSRQDDSRFDYWKRMEFTGDQWIDLAAHAADVGIEFMSSPFSCAAVELLSQTNMKVWKIASGEVTNWPMLRLIAELRQPVILSTGLASVDEVRRSLDLLGNAGCPTAVLHCTTEYPCPPEHVNLGGIEELRQTFGVEVGLSDHSGTEVAGLGAVALGAEIVEVHLTLSAHMFGPDVPASLDPGQLRRLSEGVDFLSVAMAGGSQNGDSRGRNRTLFGRSVVASRDLARGTVVVASDVAYKKPGDGMGWETFEEAFVGRRLSGDVARDEMILPEHFEPPAV